MSTARQSILMRPLKTASKKNEEHLDEEHQEAQRRLDSKKRVLETIGEHRIKTFFGSPNDKKQLQEEVKKDMDLQLSLREDLKKQKVLEDLKYATLVHQQATVMETVDNDHERARREYLRSVMEENKRLAVEREEQKRIDREKEIEAARVAKGKLLEWGGNWR